MNYPAAFVNASDDVKSEIIHVGTLVYFNGYKWFHEEDVINQRKSLESHKNSLCDVFESQYSKRLSDTKTLIESQYERVIQQMRSTIDELKERNNTLEQKCHDAMSLSGKLDSLLGKKSSIDNAAKGDFGENIVYNQLVHYYPNCVIQDVSGTTAKGDILWHMNNDSFKALVEVKNVQYVRPSDVQKFERDLRINYKNNTCNCGLFVSLKTEAIQSKGKFHFEFFESIPVIYVSNIYEDTHLLRVAFDMLLNIQQTLQSQQNNCDEVTLKEQLTQLVNTINEKCISCSKNISAMRHSCEQLSQAIKNEEHTINDLATCVFSFKGEVPVGKPLSKKQEVLQEMLQFYTTHNRCPNKSEITSVGAHWFRGDCSMHHLRQDLLRMVNPT